MLFFTNCVHTQQQNKHSAVCSVTVHDGSFHMFAFEIISYSLGQNSIPVVVHIYARKFQCFHTALIKKESKPKRSEMQQLTDYDMKWEMHDVNAFEIFRLQFVTSHRLWHFPSAGLTISLETVSM